MPDLAAAYAEARDSMTKIARELTEAQLAAKVPACPDWTVKDLITHVTSIAASLANGDFPPDLNPIEIWNEEMAARREAFVDSALSSRTTRSIAEIIAEWEEAGVAVEGMIRGERAWPPGAPPLVEWILTTDVGVHHHDLRGAVDMPGDRDSLATGLSLYSYVQAMRFRASFEKLPALRIRAGSREWVVGDGEPVATLTGDPFELSRAASGRRSPEQIRAYDWDGDPEPFIHLFYPYGIRSDALVE
jgi:uncharacterized protein (TIGR03083 family)